MNIINVTEFKKLLEDKASFIVDFSAQWCMPCKALGKVLEEISSQYTNLTFVNCDVEECTDLTTLYGIRNVPTVFFFKNGEFIDKLVGAVSKAVIIEKIDKIYV